MMKIETLENCSLQTIVQAFNEAFEVYFVPVHLDKESLMEKIQAENIMLRFSVGIFDGDRIIGFILHGLDVVNGEKLVYNAGTGVVPEYRGKGITKQLYKFIKPLLIVEDVVKCRLEVIEHNEPAIHAYEKIGFKKGRAFECFHGQLKLDAPPPSTDFEIKISSEPIWSVLPSFWNRQPTWQNSLVAMQRSLTHQQFVGIYKEKLLVAYGFIHPKKGRIGQFGVRPEFRGQGLGKRLFYALSQLGIENKDFSIINIDREDQATIRFLESVGFTKYAHGQYQMEWRL